MPEFTVWEDGKPESDAHVTEADDAEEAALEWARDVDLQSGEFQIARGREEPIINVKDEDGNVTRWSVSGEMEPNYMAMERGPIENTPWTLQWEHTNTIRLDSTIIFGKGYDFFGLEHSRLEAIGPNGKYLMWPNSGKWSLYRDTDGAMAFEQFSSREECEQAAIRWCDDVLPTAESKAADKPAQPTDPENVNRGESKTLEALQRAFNADPAAIHSLIILRVPCNEALANDPLVMVEHNPTLRGCHWNVGILGLLNAVLEANGLPLVNLEFSQEPEDGRYKLIGFCKYTPCTE